MSDSGPETLKEEATEAVRNTVEEIKPRLRGWLHAATWLLAFFSFLVLLVLSGLVLWKSVQFPLLRELLGGYEAARRVHFFAMSALVVFVVVHLAMVALVPRSLLTMIRGR